MSLNRTHNHYKNIIQLIKSLSPRHSTWEVFSDFLMMSAISLSNAIDYSHSNQRESEYMETVKKYEKKDATKFADIFASLVMAMEEDPGDILGRIYGELELSNKWTGQFFTPDSVARMMGEMIITDHTKNEIEKKGYITVQDPAIGGGALIINSALAMKAAGINYQQTMLVTGIDIDIKAIHMAYVQLSLLHVPAVLIHGDALLLKSFSSNWYTPSYVLGGWKWRTKEKDEVTENQKLTLHIDPQPAQYEAISLF